SSVAPLPPRLEKSTSPSASLIRPFWSPASSDLRVTFSVVSTVRSATSLRIRSSERRVSASMSRRAAASSSSRLSRPSWAACAVVVSAARRARATMSSACSRASRKRARSSSRILSASSRVFSADSIDSRIAFARLSSAAWMRGKATFESTHIVNPKTTSVQIIRPRLGETRKLPPESPSAPSGSAVINVTESTCAGLEEEGDQAEDERVEGDGLGQREPEPADRLEVVLHLGLAGDGLDLLAEDEADADSGSDRAEAGTNAQRNGLAGIGDSGVRDALRCLGERNQHFNHESALLCLVAFGDGAADVDGREGGEDERLQRCDQADLKYEEDECQGEGKGSEGREAEQDGQPPSHEEQEQMPREDVGEEPYGERDEPHELG